MRAVWLWRTSSPSERAGSARAGSRQATKPALSSAVPPPEARARNAAARGEAPSPAARPVGGPSQDTPSRHCSRAVVGCRRLSAMAQADMRPEQVRLSPGMITGREHVVHEICAGAGQRMRGPVDGRHPGDPFQRLRGPLEALAARGLAGPMGPDQKVFDSHLSAAGVHSASIRPRRAARREGRAPATASTSRSAARPARSWPARTTTGAPRRRCPRRGTGRSAPV